MRLYLCGKMTGEPDFNYPLFEEYAKKLRSIGLAVVSPHEFFGSDTSLPRAMYIREGMGAVDSCDGIAVIPGWEGSQGAKLEIRYARELDKPIYRAEQIIEGGFVPLDLSTGSEQIEEEARRVISADRNSQYGEPENNFSRIALVWEGILNCKVSSEQVALCMAGLKLVRESTHPKRDSRVDAIGYLLCADKVCNEN